MDGVNKKSLSTIRPPGSKSQALIAGDRNAPMFRSRTAKGRGVGMARGRATVGRARGQRGGRGN